MEGIDYHCCHKPTEKEIRVRKPQMNIPLCSEAWIPSEIHREQTKVSTSNDVTWFPLNLKPLREWVSLLWIQCYSCKCLQHSSNQADINNIDCKQVSVISNQVTVNEDRSLTGDHVTRLCIEDHGSCSLQLWEFVGLSKSSNCLITETLWFWSIC